MSKDNDLIRRSDAIDAICKTRTNDVVSYHYADLFINALYQVPSVDRPQEWIPCSERLPNENGTYLTTYEWVGKTGTKYIEIEGIDFEHGRWDCHDYEKVTAWMPLPEPWKGADDE